ncbi:MAG: M14-type cytosolic carboxypeptidase [Candidatus Hodarchaeota archaeon]
MIKIDSDFPGGNIKFITIEDDEVVITPDLRDTEGHWFWWYFRVTGASDEEIRFVFASPGTIGTNGIAVSLDGGESWSWHEDVSHGAGWIPDSFTYRIPKDLDEHVGIRFAFAIPYTQSHLNAFLSQFEDNPFLTRHVLCKSNQNRQVPYFLVGNQGSSPDFRVLLAARHHACESPANYVLEGIIEAIASPDEPNDPRKGALAKWFQEHVQVLVIPFIDADGVENGDQGKNRKPWDHNRDYGTKTIYPEVKAVKELIPRWAREGLDISLDVHAPGRTDDFFHMVGQKDPEQWKQLTLFSNILAKISRENGSALVMDTSKNVQWGTGWNKMGTTGIQRSHSSWIGTLGIARLYTTIEIPYGTVLDAPITPERLREFGHDVVEAFKEYLEG